MPEFEDIDIRAFLRASVPLRFQDISPYDFEHFIAWVFRQDGYLVEETGYSGDFGADLILTKEGQRTAVQVKRYAPGTHVTVGDMNQVIGARTYYDTDEALMMTTSDFSKSAITLGRSAGVVMWNWQRLTKYLSTILLQGEDLDTLQFEEESDLDFEKLESADTGLFELTLLELLPEEETFEGKEATAVHLELMNAGSANLTIQVDLPILISRKSGRQVSAVGWKQHYFFHGLVVSGATVELACYFLKQQIPEIRSGDRILLRVHVHGHAEPSIIDERLMVPKSNCYIVTWCYGRDSAEYRELTTFRDQWLARRWYGRRVTLWYYRLSPGIVRRAGRFPLVGHLLKVPVRSVIRLIRTFWRPPNI